MSEHYSCMTLQLEGISISTISYRLMFILLILILNQKIPSMLKILAPWGPPAHPHTTQYSHILSECTHTHTLNASALKCTFRELGLCAADGFMYSVCKCEQSRFFPVEAF